LLLDIFHKITAKIDEKLSDILKNRKREGIIKKTFKKIH